MLPKHGITVSGNIEIDHVFLSKVFFNLSNNLHPSCLKAFKFVSWQNFMEGYYNLRPDIRGKIITGWFPRRSDGYIVSIWYELFIHFSLPLKSPIHRTGNSPNILCPNSREQDESHPHYTTLNYTSLH